MVHLPVATVMLQSIRLKLNYTPAWTVLLAFPVTLLVAKICFELIEQKAKTVILRWFDLRQLPAAAPR